MGARTRQVRATYREGPTFRDDGNDTNQLLSAFVFTSGLAFAMLAGATSFSHNPSMQQWLRWAASVVMFLGCGGIGLRVLLDGLAEWKTARKIRPDAPAHMQLDRRQAIARIVVGAVLGVCVPIGIVLYQL